MSKHTFTFHILAVLLVVSQCVACAEGTPLNNAPELEDAAHSPGDVPNVRMPDQGNEPDIVPDRRGCGLCCPNERRCATETQPEFCTTEGDRFVSDAPCGEGQICMDGACNQEPVCIPNERTCYDSTTLLLCRENGLARYTMPCNDGMSCSNGECLEGSGAGGTCESNSDCASDLCHCGSGTSESCPSTLSPGYCTKRCSTGDDCSQDSICLDTAIVSTGTSSADYNHCVQKCGTTCSDGFECMSLPGKSADGLAWQDACYYATVNKIGETCESDGSCIGGNCLRGYFDTSFCTRRCDADGQCPERSACVEWMSGEYWCALLCGDGSAASSASCPLDSPVDRFDVTCKVKSAFGGGAFRVCTKP